MHAKRFFYVCAGILCLALAYHFGARSATAQASGYDCAGVNGSAAAAVINRELWHIEALGSRLQRLQGGPVPGTARVVACGINGVVLENGEAWRNFGGWEFLGTFPFSGPTPSTQETWGGVKARYRQGAATRNK